MTSRSSAFSARKWRLANLLVLAKAFFNRSLKSRHITELEGEIDALNQKLGHQILQLKQQQGRIKKRKDALLGERAKNLANKFTIDELCKRLVLTDEQKDELLAKNWELALGKVEKTGSVVPLRYIPKNVQNKGKVRRSPN